MRRIAWIAVAALVLVGCGGAHGGRPPSDAERGAITRWVDRWWRVRTIAIGPGTDLSEICTASSPRPLVDLFC